MLLVPKFFYYFLFYSPILISIWILLKSFYNIKQTESGLVTKRVSFKKLSEKSIIAFNGEPGYQAELLLPGLRFKFWPIFKVDKMPWVQVSGDEIGVVISQVGFPLPDGAKSAIYKNEFGDFTNLERFIKYGGQQGIQRYVLPPGTIALIHPIAFLVLTSEKVYGIPVNPELSYLCKNRNLVPSDFGMNKDRLRPVIISPKKWDNSVETDTIGIVMTKEGDPLPPGDIASRIGGFNDIKILEEKIQLGDGGGERNEKEIQIDSEIINTLLGNKNIEHNNYQDFQAFLDKGGKIGLQHDPLLCGSYILNPFLIDVEIVPMLVVKQGEVAVIKGYVGLPTKDTSGDEFKFGSLVRPGHRGIWHEPLRTGKYPINPRCYHAEITQTAILTLNWADVVSKAHNFDKELVPITAKSKEGFDFSIDLQVHIHVADTKAPKVISMITNMHNLVNDVLQAAVGNYFRNTLQGMPAIDFIEHREEVQKAAFNYVREELKSYDVEIKGVFIQSVTFPNQLVDVLKAKEIAHQNIATYLEQEKSEQGRIEVEKAKGTANAQADLAKSKVGVDIANNNATAEEHKARGEAAFLKQTGEAKGAEFRSVGLAKAEAYERQVKALGEIPTALVNIIEALSKSNTPFVPQILVAGGNEGNGILEALGSSLLKALKDKTIINKKDEIKDKMKLSEIELKKAEEQVQKVEDLKRKITKC